MLYFGMRDVDEANGWLDAVERTANPMIVAYGAMQVMNVLTYVPMTLWAFRAAEGEAGDPRALLVAA